MFPVTLVDMCDDVTRWTMLKVTFVCVLVQGMGGAGPVTTHFAVRTVDWSEN
jgi:hypothetical protein